ncbi:hypothetical protein T4E_1005 [Trichinella pseudospiralis]|uniref:Uncharacterized protein n=1 Tax=Trichinella pseudospiralis TaxID=6337 RepID=A0A0V0XH71_TRIPS|nr:hypothetical protein T4E_1005 [Trichinella pseudospiralis]
MRVQKLDELAETRSSLWQAEDAPVKRPEDKYKATANSKEMDYTEDHQETLYENALKKPNMDDHQLDADKKQIESNEGNEETKQDAQAVEAVANNNANDVVETEAELTGTLSGQYSKRDEEMEADSEVAGWVRKIGANIVIVPMCKEWPDGNGQHHRSNEANRLCYMDT